MDRDVDRLAKFAEMMLGQLKSAQASSEAAAACHKALTGSEAMLYSHNARGFNGLIQIGEEALQPFRSDLTATEARQD